VEATAARFEEKAALLPESMIQAWLRAAALERQVQARHLAVAGLQEQHAVLLRAWLGRPGKLTRCRNRPSMQRVGHRREAAACLSQPVCLHSATL
jgi:hypothetical protein